MSDAPPPPTRKVLLIGLDGADWNLMHPLLDAGSLPAFRHLVERGTMGNVATLWPTISPILWNAIATGKRAGKHGIHGFTEVDPQTGQVQPVSSVSRQCKALWNMLQQAGHRVHMINWFASHPAEPLNGICLSDFFPNASHPDPEADWPLPAECVHPADRRDHFEPMRIHPGELDASVGTLFVNDLENLPKEEDERLQQLSAELARAYTIQTATLDLLDNEDWNFCAIYLRTVDILCHVFMPFHPPQMEGVPDDLFAHYRDTVNSAYRLMDLMLTQLITCAGEDATVLILSDHGFLHDDLRPPANLANPFADPEGWHRDQGILLASGPGVKKDQLIHGATLLDIAPTVLTLMGEPVGRDMDGRVLTEMLEGEPEIRYIDSWERIPGDSGQHPPGKRLDATESKTLLDQFAALGYIAPLGDDAEKNARQTRTQNDWNLARDYLDFGNWEAALPLLEDLHHENPAWKEAGIRLAHCQFQLKLIDEAERSLGNILNQTGEGPMLSLLLGHIASEKGDDEAAVAHYEKAAAEVPDARDIRIGIGRAFIRLGHLDKAEAMFHQVLEADPEMALAYQGLARVYAHGGHLARTIEAATCAVALQHNLPLAHELLGDAYERVGKTSEAIAAFEAAALYDATHSGALRKLARLCTEGGALDQASTYEAMAAKADSERESPEARLDRLRAGIENRRLAREDRLLWEETESADDLREKLESHRRRVDASLRPAAGSALEPGQEFLIVSGLPRSGTSLMMQILVAAGIEPLSDEQRGADEFNPRGYFEWEELKRLAENPRLIEQGLGKVTKVVSPLLPFLPPPHRYRVIFMNRPVDEVRVSQEKMLTGLGSDHGGEDITGILGKHREQTRSLLDDSDRFSVLTVDYPALIDDPGPWIEQVLAFAGALIPPGADPAALAPIVEPALYRSRVESKPA